MNYIKQLTHFFNKSQADPGFSTTHVSLFMALFQLWNQARFSNQIQIIRDDAMRLAKINSKATYHKAMAYLHQQRYIDYQPSYNPYKGSSIAFFPALENNSIPTDEPVQILTTRPINEPYNKLYSTTIINDNSNYLSIDQKKKENQKSGSSNQSLLEFPKKEKSSAQKEKMIPPMQDHVEKFFLSHHSSTQEAQRFVNHYTANGWLVGGKSPMKDWKASAKNWITNSITFKQSQNYGKSNRAQQLQATTRKNYSEPL